VYSGAEEPSAPPAGPECGPLEQLELIRPAGAEGLLELRAIKRPDRRRYFFEDATELVARACDHDDHDVYVAAAVRARRDGSKRGVDHSWVLWADCDSPLSEMKLIKFEPPPTLIVNSGGGMHAWWRLEEPLPAEQIEPALRKLQQTLGADSTAVDMARVLRLLGTRNHKYGVPRPVTVCEFVAERVYTVEQVLEHAVPVVSEHEERDARAARASYEERRAILALRPAHGENHPDRHPTLRSWVGSLVNCFPDAPDFVEACALGLNEHRLDPPKPEDEVLALVKWTFETHWRLRDE
jgi:hypothetical protein